MGSRAGLQHREVKGKCELRKRWQDPRLLCRSHAGKALGSCPSAEWGRDKAAGSLGQGCRAAAGAGVEEQTTLTQMAPRRGAPFKRRMGEMQGQGWRAQTEGRERLASAPPGGFSELVSP